MVDASVGSLYGVGEGGEEAGEGEEEEEEEGEDTCGGVARAVVGEDGREDLEGEEGPCGKLVGQIGAAG